ncbi:MAG: metalloregulator ArsR/SmtB family transcription factor [Candidatus Beckwithbacteria bacterium]|nr:metalloregulator ArsR/SmtB family transcription factor [Patescibacteria group bacterium]MDP4030895.1 metalloregulator ArsR/SmtB family transcription factor [Candidatus Beckwithbacteria bacterium]
MYSPLFNRESRLFQALAHPKRLEVIHLLRQQELCVNEMLKMLDLPQANISQHLTLLRRAGIVKSRRDGKNILYCLTRPQYIRASDLLKQTLMTGGSSRQVVDPVCGMKLSPQIASFTLKASGKTHYFCASGCLKKFKKEPRRFS